MVAVSLKKNFFQAEDGIRDSWASRGLGDVYKRQLVALEVLFSLRKGKKASSFFDTFKKTPQILENIDVKDKSIIKNIDIKNSIKLAEKLIKGQGRILVRSSGTESKIRVMGESDNNKLLQKCLKIILKKIK